MNTGDYPISEVTVLDGGWSNDGPCIILYADFAREALSSGELPLYVHEALKALELSGKEIVILAAGAGGGDTA